MAVIAFNSTVLIESILVGKRIITPFFGDVITERAWDYFSSFPEFVIYARSVDEIDQAVFGSPVQYDEERKLAFLSQFIYRPDGQASRRAEDAIIAEIER